MDLSQPITSRGFFQRAIELCGKNLGERADAYTSAAIADDIEALRIRLGIERVDLLGQSYGTYLMQVYAQRHPDAIRSMVLSSAYPLDFDMWARENIAAVRRTARIVCERSDGACKGRGVLADMGKVADRLERKPLTYSAAGTKWTLDDTALASLVYNAEPAGWGSLPAVLDTAAEGRPKALLDLLGPVPPPSGETAARAAGPPPGFSMAHAMAVICNDYPTLWERSASPRDRERQFERALEALPRRPFAPFTAPSWPQAIMDRGDSCLRWPDRDGSGQSIGGELPDVPVLVLSGDLDANTPTGEGRAVARQFPNSELVEVPNTGHVAEASQPCAGAIERRFIRDLKLAGTACLDRIPPVEVEPVR